MTVPFRPSGVMMMVPTCRPAIGSIAAAHVGNMHTSSRASRYLHAKLVQVLSLCHVRRKHYFDGLLSSQPISRCVPIVSIYLPSGISSASQLSYRHRHTFFSVTGSAPAIAPSIGASTSVMVTGGQNSDGRRTVW